MRVVPGIAVAPPSLAGIARRVEARIADVLETELARGRRAQRHTRSTDEAASAAHNPRRMA